MKINLVALVLVAATLASCKKSSEDPSPSSSGGSRYRISTLSIRQADQNDASIYTYTYNGVGKVQEVLITNSASTQSSKEDYQYNTDGLLSSYSTSLGSYALTYNAEKLVSQIEYSALNSATQSYTTVYSYNANNDLMYSVKTQGSGSAIHKDSSSYSNYTSGRPAIKRVYNKDGVSAYSFGSKDKYTYDARMNLTKDESTTGSDSTVFYTAYTATFTVLGTKETAALVYLYASTSADVLNDNPNPGNKDNDVDFISESTSAASSCGISDKTTTTIQQENGAGYPLVVQDIDGSYNCGTPPSGSSSTTTISTVTYEVY